MAKRVVVVDEDTIGSNAVDLELGPTYESGPLPVAGVADDSLLAPYIEALGESVTWRSRSTVNEYNEPTYIDSSINVIWFDDEKMIKNAEGETFQQRAYIQTTALIQKGDAIIRAGYTWPIRGIQKTPHPNGEQFRIGNLGD